MEDKEKVSVVGEPNLADEIVSDLQESEEIKDESIPQSETPSPAFDISKLSVDQIQQLKSVLSATPDRAASAKGSTNVKIRKINDKYVIDFKQAFLGVVDDEVLQKKVERHIIPTKLEGAEDYVNIDYKRFMQSEQVDCKVLDMRKDEQPIVEGETYDEYDRLVEMIRTEVVVTLVVKTPEGRELTIPGKIANA